MGQIATSVVGNTVTLDFSSLSSDQIGLLQRTYNLSDSDAVSVVLGALNIKLQEVSDEMQARFLKEQALALQSEAQSISDIVSTN